MVEPRYEPRAEHAGIHGNPHSGNHEVLSHWESVEILTTPYTYHRQWKGRRWGRKSAQQAWMALTIQANCTFAHSWQAKHVSLAKPCMRLYRAWLPLSNCGPALAQLKLCLNHILPRNNLRRILSALAYQKIHLRLSYFELYFDQNCIKITASDSVPLTILTNLTAKENNCSQTTPAM